MEVCLVNFFPEDRDRLKPIWLKLSIFSVRTGK
jgi:hypothetical protein